MALNKPLFLSTEFFPKHDDNLMATEGDSSLARERFLTNRHANLNNLLYQRYSWMNRFIPQKGIGIEIGAGSGFSRLFLTNKSLRLTDYERAPWIDEQVDALSMPYDSDSLDFIVACQVLHHIATPMLFFKEAQRCLKPNGQILIHDTFASFFLRLMLRVMRHEGYSFDVDPFDEGIICNDPKDPWSANTAISRLLFSDVPRFENATGLAVAHLKHTECLALPLSGGVYATISVPQLPKVVLNLVNRIDEAWTGRYPHTFATGVQVVLTKSD